MLRGACVREHAEADGAGDVLFPDGVSGEFLGCGLKQKDDVVPQYAHQDLHTRLRHTHRYEGRMTHHDHGDWEEHPIPYLRVEIQ